MKEAREETKATLARSAFEAEARRQSLLLAERARDPSSDEAQVMREIAAELVDPEFWDD